MTIAAEERAKRLLAQRGYRFDDYGQLWFVTHEHIEEGDASSWDGRLIGVFPSAVEAVWELERQRPSEHYTVGYRLGCALALIVAAAGFWLAARFAVYMWQTLT